MSEVVLDVPDLAVGAHTPPGASYATMSCSEDHLSGFVSKEVSAVVEEQSASVAHVTESSQHLATVAARLKSGMSRFGL